MSTSTEAKLAMFVEAVFIVELIKKEFIFNKKDVLAEYEVEEPCSKRFGTAFTL